MPAVEDSAQRRKPGKRVVIGTAMLTEIRRDMQPEKQDRPSSFSPVPKMLGSTKTGKLTADQWHTVACVHLPITLIRVWGHLPLGNRFREMLDNFIDLVTAMRVALSRTINPDLIKKYTSLMVAYLAGMCKLYKHKAFTPNHHLELHYGEHLTRFGPAHASRCYVFERQNLTFQRISTNSKLGETLLFPSFGILIVFLFY